MRKKDAAPTSLANDSSLKDNSESAYQSKSYFDLNEMAGRRGYSIAHLPYVETPEARRELIEWLTAYDKRLLVPTPTTQDTASAPAQTTTSTDKGSVQHKTKPKDCGHTRCNCSFPLPESTSVSSFEIAIEAVREIIGEFESCLLVPDGYTAEMFYLKRWSDIISKRLAAYDVLKDENQKLLKWVEDANVRNMDDQDEHSEQRAKLAKENESLRSQLSQLQQERDRLQQLWDLDRTAARVFQQERDALKRGEFVCKVCGIRKDSECDKGDF